MSVPVIVYEHATVYYGDTLALDDLTMSVAEGEFLSIVGHSGCGKTTALKLVNGLLKPSSGRVLVEGKDIAETDVIALRRNIGYVIQSIGLFPHMTVGKNIAYVPSLSKLWSKKEEKEKVAELLEIVSLDPALAGRYPSELSGGQRQRVGVARALAAKPRIMLMDEPFGAVDEIARRSLRNELQELQRKLNITIMFVTHDIEEALKLGTRVMVMEKGRVVQLDTPDVIKNDPATEFVRELVSLK